MILIGQYDSPFVRRVGIALTLYDLPFEHRPWSIFGDAEAIRPYNPLVRVPVLVLDDGTSLVESLSILDALDNLVAESRRLFPSAQPARREAMNIAALAMGVSDKAVSLFYELRLHADPSPVWVERCRGQIEGALAKLDDSLARRDGPYWSGANFGHADIAIAVMLRHLTEAHPGLMEASRFPRLAEHAARMEALPVFKAVSQPFIAPA